MSSSPVLVSLGQPVEADPGPGANPEAGYGSKLKGAVQPTAETSAPAAPASGSSDEDDELSTGAWLAIGGGALLLAVGAFTLGRSRRRTHA